MINYVQVINKRMHANETMCTHILVKHRVKIKKKFLIMRPVTKSNKKKYFFFQHQKKKHNSSFFMLFFYS